jgi:homogentisate 1,2-dioxygenase
MVQVLVDETMMEDPFLYLNGFGNEFQSEVITGAIPLHRNNPKQVPYNLYAEQLSGTAFTISPRHSNRRTWCYRIQPSVAGRWYDNDSTIDSKNKTYPYFGHCHPKECLPTIEPIRWIEPPSSLLTLLQEGTTTSSSTSTNSSGNNTKDDTTRNNSTCTASDGWNFMEGMILMCTAGDIEIMKHGLNIYMYTDVTKSMTMTEHLCNIEGDFLIVPQTGTLIIHTEFGRIQVQPTEIVVIPRGIIFQILIPDQVNKNTDHPNGAQGYLLEISTAAGNGFRLPDLGPIGSNGLANGRDFQIPTAWCAATSLEEYHQDQQHVIYNKVSSQLVPCYLNHTPYNVVGWYGNYVPYKYNLHYFCTINSVSYDHIDPSIYTVLTCPSNLVHGTALADFVVFAPRTIATDANTLRPPWFHKNVMSEFMGLIYGEYDAKVANTNIETNQTEKVDAKRKRTGFVPGGASLHNCMTPHGPDAISYHKAVADPCDTPKQLKNGMAFMFETYLPIRVAPHALHNADWRDVHYNDCWQKSPPGNTSNNNHIGLGADHFNGWDLLTTSMKKSY